LPAVARVHVIRFTETTSLTGRAMSTDATGLTTFAISGHLDDAAAVAIESAIRSLDREAIVKVSLAADLVSVQSRAATGDIRAAINAVGFDAEPTSRPFPRERVQLSTVGWTLIGAVITPIITFLLVLAAVRFNPACGAPGDSGGCDMDLVSITILSVLPGAVLGFLFAITSGWWVAWRRTPVRYAPPMRRIESEIAAD
jgi:hypothetical protein